MNISLYIGTEKADFNEAFNVMFSIGDVRNFQFGSNNKSYTLNLPLTKTNKRLLSYINQPDVKSETSSIGRLFLGDLFVIQGKVKILSLSDQAAKVIINSDDWIDSLGTKKLSDLNLTDQDHYLDSATVSDSWSASYPFYRYPMINFGALASAETGTTANWLPNDFIPMFSVCQIIEKILSPYTISSSFLSLAAIKDLFILAKETIANDKYINDKAFEAKVLNASDNSVNGTINAGQTKSFTITDAVMDLQNIITDQASAFTGNQYTIPESGTYYLSYVAVPLWVTEPGITINSQQIILEIRRTRGAVTDVLTTQTVNYSSTNILNTTYTLLAKYIYLEAGDIVFVTRFVTQSLTNTSIDPIDINISFTTSTDFKFIWNSVCLYTGLNQLVECDKKMPDMTQLEFLTAIRDIFNLRFWVDKIKQVIYIEPWDSFISSTVVDLTDYLDNDDIPNELLSNYFNKQITLKWKDDSSDKAYEEYLKTAVSPNSKDIILTSLFTKPEPITIEHPFSSFIKGINSTIGEWYVSDIPRIWNTAVLDDAPIIFDRLTNFNTRIVKWEGLTSGFTWYYDSVAKTTYPKISPVDWSATYSAYWIKFYHYIDKGKLFTVKIKNKPLFLQQFQMVVNTATSEGFRPTYMITIKGIDHYFVLQKIISDGVNCELELILRT
jgi:hypothetical protein